MGIASKTITAGFAFAGLACASQLPEFAQQYRQRLAGAVEELRVVVSDFDKDAAASNLSRDKALQDMLEAEDRFPRDRGNSMMRVINRFDRLEAQRLSMEQAEPVERPIHLISSLDQKVLEGTWEIFEPAVPLTFPGLVWGGIGALFFGLFARVPIGAARRMKRSRRKDTTVPAKSDPAFFEEPDVPDTLARAENPLIESLLNQPGQSTIPKERSAAPKPEKRPPRDAPRSLLEQVRFKQRIVGELDDRGMIIPKKANDD